MTFPDSAKGSTRDDLAEGAREAALRLAGQAHVVGRDPDTEPWRVLIQWIRWWLSGWRRGWPVAAVRDALWQDMVSGERSGGWRTRAAVLGREHAFAVDYHLCRRCRLGWVERPHTMPEYQRCGLASAALAQLRAEHPGLFWHMLGGHFRESRPFWAAVGAGVPGGYQQREVCPHITNG
ncbi:unnamed protein product [[Actinomadura] parvosata subsp. kistnae]|uniref:hypothetical protein n=1 Tax=[Actinomadura] parvosata TaxID=1955412 RepID=UPI000D296798|nr:unnamed protein product [Actinomadura parvosata subsp. kistnae]